MSISRRKFLYTGGTAIAGASVLGASAFSVSSVSPKHPVCLFSKHLQYLDIAAMSEVVARAGFDGIDLTVRNGGHIDPARVAELLPKAIKSIRSFGLSVPMMTSGIVDPNDPLTAKILAVAADNGITHYRMGPISYDPQLSIQQNLDGFKIRFEKLEKINRKYRIHGGYQNHWGRNFGSPVWDLYSVVKDIDPQWIGCQYDVRHAVAEGGSSWLLGMKAIAPHIGSTVIKDLIWAKTDGKWKPESVPLGTGMVDFKLYFDEYAKLPNAGPVSLHYEYGIGQQSKKDEKLTVENLSEFYRNDLVTLRKMMTG